MIPPSDRPREKIALSLPDPGGAGSPTTGCIHMSDVRDRLLPRSLQHMQDNMRRAGPAAAASYTLMGAILLLGGAGFAVDRWQGTAPWFLLLGLLLGIAVGFVELARTIWKR